LSGAFRLRFTRAIDLRRRQVLGGVAAWPLAA
jgi:hypothetical protein